jgi:hypothetical protein
MLSALLALACTWYNRRMANDPDATRYYVRATNPANNEQIVFECVGLAAAHAKAAELRMGRFKDVVMSVAKASQDDEPPK